MNNNNNNNNNKNMHQMGNEFSMFVGDLPHDCTDEKLHRLFHDKFKSVKRVQIIKHEDGSSRGFGFIRFESQAEFEAALTQPMKAGDTTLRLDRAHNPIRMNRKRFNSFNSTGGNNNNHHNHHHQHHHFNNNNNNLHHNHQQHLQHHQNLHQQQHHQQQQHQLHHQNQQPQQSTPQAQQQQHPQPPPSSSSQQPQSQQLGSQSHQSSQQNNPNQNKAGASLMQDPANITSSQQHLQQASNNHQPLSGNPRGVNNNLGVSVGVNDASLTANITATESTNLSSSNVNNSSNNVLNNHHNLGTSQQAIPGPDMRGYTQPTMMDTSHLMSTEQPSMMPPTSGVYGHVYPYGPPPTFGYMHPPPPPQPNPVIPISAVPPAPPNQASPSSALSQQHPLTASSATRYNDTQPHQQQQQALAHGQADPSGMGSMAGGVQGPHQGPPFYYYNYIPQLYFDQSGGVAGPPNMYHPQSFHPQFFALPSPAYMPNAHTYNQHQPPTASQSDASLINPQQQQQQQQPQQQQPPSHPQPPTHQPQVNLRTRDIDTTIE